MFISFDSEWFRRKTERVPVIASPGCGFLILCIAEMYLLFPICQAVTLSISAYFLMKNGRHRFPHVKNPGPCTFRIRGVYLDYSRFRVIP